MYNYRETKIKPNKSLKMESKKTLVLLLVVAVLIGAAFFLLRSSDADSGKTSLLNAEVGAHEVITPEDFAKNSKDYTLELTANGEVVAR